MAERLRLDSIPESHTPEPQESPEKGVPKRVRLDEVSEGNYDYTGPPEQPDKIETALKMASMLPPIPPFGGLGQGAAVARMMYNQPQAIPVAAGLAAGAITRNPHAAAGAAGLGEAAATVIETMKAEKRAPTMDEMEAALGKGVAAAALTEAMTFGVPPAVAIGKKVLRPILEPVSKVMTKPVQDGLKVLAAQVEKNQNQYLSRIRSAFKERAYKVPEINWRKNIVALEKANPGKTYDATDWIRNVRTQMDADPAFRQNVLLAVNKSPEPSIRSIFNLPKGEYLSESEIAMGSKQFAERFARHHWDMSKLTFRQAHELEKTLLRKPGLAQKLRNPLAQIDDGEYALLEARKDLHANMLSNFKGAEKLYADYHADKEMVRAVTNHFKTGNLEKAVKEGWGGSEHRAIIFGGEFNGRAVPGLLTKRAAAEAKLLKQAYLFRKIGKAAAITVGLGGLTGAAATIGTGIARDVIQ